MKLLFSVLCIFGLLFCSNVEAGIKKSNLKVLYVGGSPDLNDATAEPNPEALEASVPMRMKAFEDMLKDYFKNVTVIHADDYTPELSDNYDVTIMDGLPKPLEPKDAKVTWERTYDAKEYRFLPYDFDRPMLTIADMGAVMGESIGLHFDWLCLCLNADAFNINMEHPIFKGPFPVKMTMQNKPTPEPVKEMYYYSDDPITDSLAMWRVQVRGYEDTTVRRGLMSMPIGRNEPDAEFICSGVSMKWKEATAIGRHGNFFQWGFAASPLNMTEEAKAVFANAVVYIAGFAGQAPIVRVQKENLTRSLALKSFIYSSSYKAYEDDMERYRKWDLESYAKQKEAQAKQARGEELTEDDQYYLTFKPRKRATYEEKLQKRFPELYQLYGNDGEAYATYFRENAPYFIPKDGEYRFIIDEDARSLGIPNDDIRILDKAITMWEQGIEVAKARRILTRYTLCRFETPAEWRTWFEANEARLFFSEEGGWVFLVNTQDKNEPGNDYRMLRKRPEISIPGLQKTEELQTSEQHLVDMKAHAEALANGNRQIVIRVKIHDGYHIYAKMGDGDPFIATKVEFELPEGVAKVGELEMPAGEKYNDAGTTIYEDEVTFRQEVSGKGTVKCKVTYQCCNDQSCTAPMEVELSVE